jgi:phosphate transport system ATP-binding protein
VDWLQINKKEHKTLSPLENTVRVENFNAWYGSFNVLKNINMQVYKHNVTAIIGPSGCGKTTFIRCINRLHELVPYTRTNGKIYLNGKDVYASDPMEIRQNCGMVFQQPNPFPTMTVAGNVMAGYYLNGIHLKKQVYNEILEDTLRKAALWDEVKDKLNKPGIDLSGGQQQRLCIARAIAPKPNIILFDEPCSALDPVATGKIEELIRELKAQYTILIVTHNMQQAARVADYTAFFLLGDLIEFSQTDEMFTNPKNHLTEEYITGRFG